jgi:hypothetical protein
MCTDSKHSVGADPLHVGTVAVVSVVVVVNVNVVRSLGERVGFVVGAFDGAKDQ